MSEAQNFPFEILVTSRGGTVRQLPIRFEPFIVGSDPNANLQLTGETIIGAHVRILVTDNGEALLLNLAPPEDTMLNDTPLATHKPTPWRAHEILKIDLFALQLVPNPAFVPPEGADEETDQQPATVMGIEPVAMPDVRTMPIVKLDEPTLPEESTDVTYPFPYQPTTAPEPSPPPVSAAPPPASPKSIAQSVAPPPVGAAPPVIAPVVASAPPVKVEEGFTERYMGPLAPPIPPRSAAPKSSPKAPAAGKMIYEPPPPADPIEYQHSMVKDWQYAGSLSGQVTINQVNLVPGERVRISISLHNEYQQDLDLQTFITGLPLEWVTLAEPVIKLAVGEIRLVEMVIQAEPPVYQDQAQMNIRLVDIKNPQITLALPLKVVFKKLPDLIGWLEPSVIREPERAYLYLENHTQGNARVFVAGYSVSKDVLVVPAFSEIDLPPGQTAQIPLTFQVKKRGFLNAQLYDFGVTAQQGTRAPLDYVGKLRARPQVSALGLLAMLLLLIGIIAAAIFGTMYVAQLVNTRSLFTQTVQDDITTPQTTATEASPTEAAPTEVETADDDGKPESSVDIGASFGNLDTDNEPEESEVAPTEVEPTPEPIEAEAEPTEKPESDISGFVPQTGSDDNEEVVDELEPTAAPTDEPAEPLATAEVVPVLPTSTPPPTITPAPLPTAATNGVTVTLDVASGFIDPRHSYCTVPIPAGWRPYEIQEGDNLFRLALNYGTTQQEIIRVNCLTGPTYLVAYTLILLPEIEG